MKHTQQKPTDTTLAGTSAVHTFGSLALFHVVLLNFLHRQTPHLVVNK